MIKVKFTFLPNLKKRLIKNRDKSAYKIASLLTSPQGQKIKKALTKRKSRLFIIYGFIVIAILAPVIYLANSRPKESEASWFNDNWGYRQRIPITNAGTAQTDFQVSFVLDTSALVTAGKMQSDCDDIRIVGEDGKVLPYWIEENNPGCNQTTTKIWTKVPSIPTTGSNIYIYYGNSSATGVQDGGSVFLLFDDFSASSLNAGKWYSAGTISITGGAVRMAPGKIQSVAPLDNTVIVESRSRVTSTTYTTTAHIGLALMDSTQADGYGFWPFYRNDLFWQPYWRRPGVYTSLTAVSSWVAGTWYRQTVKRNAAVFSFDVNGSNIYSGTHPNSASLGANTYLHATRIWHEYANGDGPMEIDWVAAREFASTEPVVGTLASEEITPGPIAYWKFDEGQGTSTYDSISATTGTLTSSPVWKSKDLCLTDNCLQFNGSSNYVNTGRDLSWSVSDSFSISAWVNLKSTGNITILGKGTTGSTWEYSLKVITATPYFVYWNTSGVDTIGLTSSDALTLNKWQQIGVTYNGSTNVANMYLDGKLVATQTGVTGTFQNRTNNLNIGGGYYVGGVAGYFPGFIDEVKVFSYTRSAEQIQQDYIKGAVAAGGSSAAFGYQDQSYLSDELVGYWKMDESATPSLDSSGNNLSGTWNGTPTAATGKFGNGVSFNGSSSYVSHTAMTLSATSGSVCWWGQTDTVSSYIHGAFTYSPSYSYRYIALTETGLLVESDTNGDAHGFAFTRDTNWHHYCVTFGVNNSIAYVDGQEVGKSTPLTNVISFLTFGRGLTNPAVANFYDGIMDEVRIYNRALSSSEVESLYNFAPGPVAYYNFSQNSGTSTLYDNSGNGHDGTLINYSAGEGFGPGKYGPGYDADGSNHFIEVPDSTDIDLVNDFTVSFWMRPKGGFTTNSDRYLGVLDKGNYKVFLDNTNGKLTAETAHGGTTWATSYDGASHGMYSLAAYNDKLYAGQGSSGAGTADLYSYDGSSWTLAYNDTGDSFIRRLAYFDGNLYLASGDYSAFGTLYKYNGSTVTNTTFCTISSLTYPAGAFATYQGRLYAGVATIPIMASNLGYVCRYDGSSWSVNHTAAAGEVAVHGLQVYNNKLYKGIWGNAIWGDVAEYDGSSWSASFDGTSSTGDNRGFGVYRGKLLALNSEPDTIQQFDGSSWSQLYSSTYVGYYSAASYNGDVYVGTNSSVIKYDGSSWSTVYTAAAGSDKINALTVWRGDLYAGVVDDGNIVTIGDVIKLEGGDYLTGTATSWNEDWYYVTLTKSGTSMKMYVNGALNSSTTLTDADLSNNSQPLLIGTGYGSRGVGTGDGTFEGGLDEVRIYNYARDQKQIVSDMNASHPNVGSPVASPTVYWKFDEGYGDSVNNSGSAGTSANGDLTGACPGAATCPTWSNSGKFGKALNFDGSGDRFTFTTANALSLSAGTVSLWINSDQAQANPAFAFSNPSSGSNSRVYFSFAGDSMVRATLGATLIGTYTLTDGEWYHLVLAWDGTDAAFYVNGVDRTTTATFGGMTSYVTTSIIGCQNTSGTQCFDGRLDEIKTYSYALTSDEVKVDYNQGKSAVLGSTSTEYLITLDGDVYNPDSSGNAEYCVPGSNDPCDPPVAEWKMDENTGGSAYDTSGNGYTGALGVGSSAPSWTKGVKGQGLNFDGSNDYVAAPPIDFDSTNFTVTGWIYMRSSSALYSQFVGTWSGSGTELTWGVGRNWNDSCTANAQSIYFQLYGGSLHRRVRRTPDNSLSLNAWHHFAAVRTGSDTTAIYIDGVSQSLTLCTSDGVPGSDVTNPSRSVEIGSRNISAANTNGIIDNVRIYDYARTPAQITWEYRKGAPIAHYKMDECEGTTIYNSAPTFNDTAPGNNGTLTIGGSGQASVGTCTTSGAWADGATGKHGASVSFDGTDDYISCSDANCGGTSKLDGNGTNTLGWTVSAWFNMSTTGTTGDIVGKSSGNGGVGYVLERSSGNKICMYFENTGPCSTTTLGAGTWYHAVGVYDGTNVKIYLDGSLENSTSYSGGVTDTTSEFVIGARNNSGTSHNAFFAGQIDDAKIFNYALTPQQIKTEYNSGTVRFD